MSDSSDEDQSQNGFIRAAMYNQLLRTNIDTGDHNLPNSSTTAHDEPQLYNNQTEEESSQAVYRQSNLISAATVIKDYSVQPRPQQIVTEQKVKQQQQPQQQRKKRKAEKKKVILRMIRINYRWIVVGDRVSTNNKLKRCLIKKRLKKKILISNIKNYLKKKMKSLNGGQDNSALPDVPAEIQVNEHTESHHPQYTRSPTSQVENGQNQVAASQSPREEIEDARSNNTENKED